MPMYEFRLVKTGRVVERFFTMTDAPSIGSKVKVTGGMAIRLPARTMTQVKEYEHTSLTLPKNCPHAPRHDKAGRCQIKGKKELRETMAKVNADPSLTGGGKKYEWS